MLLFHAVLLFPLGSHGARWGFAGGSQGFGSLVDARATAGHERRDFLIVVIF